MSKLLNTFITKEHLPLKQFKLEVIKILFNEDEWMMDNDGLSDEEVYAKLRILKRMETEVLEGKEMTPKKLRDMTHWALQNIS